MSPPSQSENPYPLKGQLEFVRMKLLADAAFVILSNDFPVTSEEIAAFYASNKSRFEKVKVQAIYVAFRTEALPEAKGTSLEAMREAAKRALDHVHSNVQRSESEAKAIVDKVISELRSGADFEMLVERHSDDPVSKANRGDFAVIGPDDVSYPDELKQVVLSLQPGQVGRPLRQTSGYYIVRVTERILRSQDEVRELVVREVRTKKMQTWFESLRQRFTLKILKPEFFTRPTIP